jgi:hypothetical protein
MEDVPPHRAVSPEVARSPSESSENAQEPAAIVVGGEIATPAFCLLDGVAYGKHLDPRKSNRVTVPITRIPATLGRAHETDDPNFFSLGPNKALSREQCRIYFQEPNGSRFVFGQDGFTLEPYKGTKKRHVIPLHDDEPLPETGFFAIECLGKNKITVGTHKVEQGEVAQLENETPIRMSTVCLFFLLPTDARETAMEIPDPHAHKRKRVSSANSEYSSAKRAATSGSALQQELDNMSTEELLEEMKKAMDAGEWTVRHRFMGGVLAYRAVQDASRSKKIRAIVQEHGGIQKKDIIDYIAKNPTYSAWVKHHLGRVEFQSYQALVTKVLQKAGYERVGTKKTGRFVRWNLPKSAQEEEAVSDDEMEEAENDIDDNDESASDDENKPPASADSSNGSGSDDESDEVDEKDDGDENVASGEDSHASHSNNGEDDISSEGGSAQDEQLSDTNTGNGLPKGDNLDQDEASSGSEDDSNLDQNMEDAGEHDAI